MANANQRISEYVLDERLGGGAFGEVWKAHHHVWVDQFVAIKIPSDPQFLRNLQNEGAVIHGLVHPNIVRAIGFDPYADPGYLVTEYIPGTSLRPLIADKKLTPDQAVAIMRQMLMGLSYAHKTGLIHRDIKPENILIHERSQRDGYAAEGVVKLADFGLGKSVTAGKGSIVYSQSIDSPQSREIAGTLDYMPPEQRSGGAPDARADLYACGVVLYEMLTGERPAGTEVPSELNRRSPLMLDEIFKRSYTRLEKRYASADEMLKALNGAFPPALNGAPRPATAPPPLTGAVGFTAPPPLPRNNIGMNPSQMNPGQRPPPLNQPPQNVPKFAVPPAMPKSPPRFTQGGVAPRLCNMCRQPVDPDDQFCMHCGTQLVATVRRCKKCGAFPDGQDRYCIFCGESLSDAKAPVG